jgi:hypothetical protein
MTEVSNGTPNVPIVVNTTIEDLYKSFGELADAKENAGKLTESYLKIVSGTKSGPKEKQLASQFITRFFKHFPKEMAIAIDSIFDLCEDDDVSIRKAAIKDLGVLCKDCTVEHLNRIADILTQLLQTEDQLEFSQVQCSLLTVFKQNPKSTLNEIFNQINTAELEEVRKRAIKFLVSKLPGLFDVSSQASAAPPANNPFNKELEDVIIKNVKQVLLDVDAEEFILFIRLLTALPSMNTLTGRQDLVTIIMAQSDLDKPFDSNDLERIMILLSCIQEAIPLFSKNVQPTKYVNLYLENVLTVFNKIDDENVKFEVLKALSDMCLHYNGTSVPASVNSLSNLEILYDIMCEYLPKPNEEAEQLKSELADQQEAKFNFSYAECLIYSFHVLARYHPEFLSAEANKERLKDFRLRLQYFAKGTQNYIKELRNTLSNSDNNKENEENKIRRVALRVTTNIDTLIKDLFHNPPSFKSSITVSWKANDLKEGIKRSLSNSVSTDFDGAKRRLPERGIYTPPSGKYSTTNSGAGGENNKKSKRRTFSNGSNRGGGGSGGGGGGAGGRRVGRRF